MVLDSCAKFCLKHNWWFYLDPIPSSVLPEQNSHFPASSLLLRFSWRLHACTLAINSAGSVSKTSDTWWQYRYLPKLVSIDSIDTWYRYRAQSPLSGPSVHSLYCDCVVDIRVRNLIDYKAWFHDSEILREKLFMRNTDGCTWIIPLNFLFASKKFASPVSRIQFYSLQRRKFNRIIHAQPSVFRINSFSRRISLSWNQALKTDDCIWDQNSRPENSTYKRIQQVQPLIGLSVV